jgi:hypothetical protein
MGAAGSADCDGGDGSVRPNWALSAPAASLSRAVAPKGLPCGLLAVWHSLAYLMSMLPLMRFARQVRREPCSTAC